MKPIYLDHNATTAIGGAVRAAMETYLGGQFGNPLTTHRFGEAPRAAVEAARADALATLGAEGGEWQAIFNSGATEGLNHAIKGLAFAGLVDGRAGPRRRIVIGATEHYAVRKPAAWLAQTFGFEVVEVPVASDGRVPVDAFVAQLDPETTLLASLVWANNEVGTLQPVEEVGSACRSRGIPFVCDAVQAVGKLDVSGAASFSDLVAVSAHKFHGPKGAGLLARRRAVPVAPLVHGAPQEEDLRAGTHDVAGIVGLSAALHAAREEQPQESRRLSGLRAEFWKHLRSTVQGCHWNGEGTPLLPNTLNVSFDGCPSHDLCAAMDSRGVAISAGSACESGKAKPSRNLLAMGLSEGRALTSVRISLGHSTTAHDLSSAVEAFAASAKEIRRSL